MAITYHAGRRIQGLNTDILNLIQMFDDDLTSSTNWNGLSGAFSYDSTNDEIDYNCDTSLSTAYWNLGSTLNSDEWIFRTKLDIDTFSATSANIQQLNITLSDGTGNRSATQDSIGFMIRIDSAGSKFQTQWGNNQTLASNTSNFTTTPSTGTYYVEIKRTSSSTFTVTLYSDSGYSTIIDTKDITGVTATSLQYVKLATYSEATNNNLVGSVDDIKIYDGVSSITNKPSNVQLGSRYEETDTRKIYYKIDRIPESQKWQESGSIYLGGRGVFAGGYDGSNHNTIEYITISTTGNTTDFGDLTRAVRNGAVCANQERGIYCGGYDSSYSDDIDYITIQTPSNATTFGTFGDTQTNGMMGIGSETRALFGGGETSMTNRIDYLTIATPSNSTSFGTLSVSRKGGGTTGDGTKGIFMGGEEGGQHGTTMDYVTIDADPTVTATDWGDLDIGTASASVGVISNGTIGLLAVGVGYSNRVDKKTIATNANSSDYGDLTVGRQQGAQCSTETRGVFGGGKTASGSNYTNTIDYMTIANGGTATDFGDLSNARYILGGMSDTGAVRS